MAKSNMSASSFVWSIVNPLQKPLKCFVRLLDNILWAWERFLNGILASRLVECQLKMVNMQGDQAPAKGQNAEENS
jgi:hypothetical protein